MSAMIDECKYVEKKKTPVNYRQHSRQTHTGVSKNRCVKNKIFITVLSLHVKTPPMHDVQRFLHKTTESHKKVGTFWAQRAWENQSSRKRTEKCNTVLITMPYSRKETQAYNNIKQAVTYLFTTHGLTQFS